ncbi:Spore maturation protein CgeB [Methylocapsa palsarum]|uniref:Spore maturation protein CgeB n=1 Tax=Methylocapsa palsarum TaxID=1612308 RepID=A0A1I4B353_9HYPH|nr:Spore maturation protein CgeB [Methylocapsa palsarum]
MALERLGHVVSWVDPYDWVSPWMGHWLFHAGGFGIGLKINRPIFKAVEASRPDLIWVDQGDYLDARLISRLRTLSVPIVNYTVDDPFGGRDGRRFNNYLRALPFYDLLAVVREENVAEAYARGARNVMRIWRSADEVAHRPRALTDEDFRKWGSEVCFIGTWFPERGPFMAELIRAGLPLSIWGGRWQKAPEWPIIAPHWRGPGQDDPEIYARIIQCAKISLGLLSKGNRDRHTTRSLEIPAIGGLLCAERTDEHCEAFKEGVEAVYWKDAQECVEQCRRLLSDENRIETLKAQGHERYVRSNYNNESVVDSILKAAFHLDGDKREPAGAPRIKAEAR